MGTAAVRVLDFHAGYRCGRSGACCTSNWPIPVEADRAARIRAALATGALRLPDASIGRDTFPQHDGAPLLPLVHGRCTFFDEAGGRLCRVHRVLGHDALPLACRQFPRVAVRDPRGVSVTLSHYCPTAAAMLRTGGRVTIAENPIRFPVDAEYEGLDARTSLPPLLRPDMLMDWESWWEFERRAVELLGSAHASPEIALARLRRVVERTRNWRPGEVPLLEWIREAFTSAPAALGHDVSSGMTREQIDLHELEIMSAIPADAPARTIKMTSGVRAPERVESDDVTRRFLAAHAFANWTIHLGQGLRTWRRSIDAAYALMASGRDVREADLLLRHLSDPAVLATKWGHAEGEGRGRGTR